MVCPQTAYGLSAECLIDGCFILQTGAKLWFQPGAGVFNELALNSAPIFNLYLLFIYFRLTKRREGGLLKDTEKATFDITTNNQNALWNISNQESLNKSAKVSYSKKKKTKKHNTSLEGHWFRSTVFGDVVLTGENVLPPLPPPQGPLCKVVNPWAFPRSAL